MAARGPNPARGALKSGPRPGTDKRKMARVINLSNDPFIVGKFYTLYFTPVLAAYTPNDTISLKI